MARDRGESDRQVGRRPGERGQVVPFRRERPAGMGLGCGRIAAECSFAVLERIIGEVSEDVRRLFKEISRVVEQTRGNEGAVSGLVLSEEAEREIENWVRYRFENHASIVEG